MLKKLKNWLSQSKENRQWQSFIKKVDFLLEEETNLKHYDLPEFNWQVHFANGVTPEDAVEEFYDTYPEYTIHLGI